MLLNLFLLIASTFGGYLLLWSWHESTKIATPKRVIQYLREQSYLAQELALTQNEKEAEIVLAQSLQKKFPKVQTQVSVAGAASRREKVDIDIGEGKLGLEIKLARTLRRSNERNRLLGQMDLYAERFYGKEKLLVLILGKGQEAQKASIIELQKILDNKKIAHFFINISV